MFREEYQILSLLAVFHCIRFREVKHLSNDTFTIEMFLKQGNETSANTPFAYVCD